MNNGKDPFFGLSHEEYLRKIGIDNLRPLIVAEKWKIGDPHKHGEAVEAVRRFDAAQLERASASKNDREERALKLAEDANYIARQARSDARTANRIAISAAILATIATICAATITVIFSPQKESTKNQHTKLEQTKINNNSTEQ